MKNIQFLIIAWVFGLLLPTVSCSQRLQPTVPERIFTRQDSVFTVRLHEKFVIELPSHVGGGYKWVFEDSTYKSGMLLTHRTGTQPSPMDAEASPPTIAYHFQAFKRGIVSLKMADIRAWEKTVAESQKVKFIITIK